MLPPFAFDGTTLQLICGVYMVHDPQLHEIIEREKRRQFRGLEMIASEVRNVNTTAGQR